MGDIIQSYARGGFPSLPALLALVAAGERGGFTAAARALGITQPAISREIRQAERLIGRPLFRRSPRGVELTPEGRQLLDAALSGLKTIADAVERIRQPNAARHLTIGADFGFAAHWLTPRLPDFAAKVPNVDVRIMTAQHVERTVIGDCDIAVMFGAGRWPGVKTTRLFQETVYPVCAPNYPVGSPTARPDWLAEATLLHLVDTDGGGDWFGWSDWFEAANMKKPHRGRNLQFNIYTLVLQAAMAGQGIAIGWAPLVEPFIASGQLKRAHNTICRSTRGYFLARPKSGSGNPLVAEFEEWLMGAIEGKA